MILSQPIIYKTQTNYNLVAHNFLKQTWNLLFVCVFIIMDIWMIYFKKLKF